MYLIGILLLVLYLASFLLSINQSYIDKLSPYECGLEPIGSTRIKLTILYFIIGILYLLFD
jgi:NADH:ubiquinone oxidoreductase subunit 3 (subunit A)